MLVLSRHANESILIMPNVRITVLELLPGRVRIGIEAPDEVEVWREELWIKHGGRLDGRKRKQV